jgi:hypothetical protein
MAPLYDADSGGFAIVVGDQVLLAGDLSGKSPVRLILLPPDVSLDAVCKSSAGRPLPDGLPETLPLAPP